MLRRKRLCSSTSRGEADRISAVFLVPICAIAVGGAQQRLPRRITCVDRAVAALIENQDGEGVAVSRLHSRRSDRHTRHRQPDCLWPLFQEAFDLGGWNMSLYRVAVHYRR